MKTQLQTKKLFVKLMLAALSLIIVVTMTVSVSYAWLTLSKNPSVSGAQIAISGGNTILLAPDIKTTGENGETVHYPGAFSDSLTFSGDTYAYLSNLAGLRPISTADGVYWIAPTSDNEYMIDGSLANANLTASNRDGSYIYVDFWVVSPGSEYYLRVSTDARSHQGSSLVDIPKATADESALTGFRFGETNGKMSSSVRVGFLANNDAAKDEDTLEYSRSSGYETRYSKLVGSYQEPGETPSAAASNRFTIYEPDGTRHAADNAEQGSYVETKPYAYNAANNTVYEADIRDKLTVQTSSAWRNDIDQVFQTGISGKTDITEENAVQRFLNDYLQWQITPYVTTGSFFTRTSTLYRNMTGGVVSADAVGSNLTTSGATDDVYITMLQRNTPQRIRMFIWVEGQDIDCADSNSEQGSFVLNLELAGANN